MNKFINYINDNLAPKLNKLTSNIWMSSIQDSIGVLLPFILVGSLIGLVNNFGSLISGFPNLSPISNFTFGILGLLLAFMIPSTVLQKKRIFKFQYLAGFTGIGTFLLMSGMTIDSDNMATVFFMNFGAAGMFVAIILGVIISLVMIFFNKYSFFKNNDTLPEIVITWFDSLIPIFLCFLGGWLVTNILNFNIFEIVGDILAPLFSSSNTLGGLVAIVFSFCFIYSFGISGWAIFPILGPILIANTAANVAAGGSATNISTYEVVLSGWCAIGGTGSTLALSIMMFFSKAKRINAIGKAAIVPSIFNINEPVVYGLPIAMNPIMMIPLWINGLVVPVITYLVLSSGLVPIPNISFTMQFIPSIISTYLIANNSLIGPLFALIIFGISALIWYPFFKAYEKTVIVEEAAVQD